MRIRAMAIAAASAALIAGGLAATPAQASRATVWGCPGGAVCMYTEAGFFADTPQHIWYSYGYHALTNEYGKRVIFNNQYYTSSGWPGAYACTSTSASSCGGVIATDDWTYPPINITPINYIRLTASGG